MTETPTDLPSARQLSARHIPAGHVAAGDRPAGQPGPPRPAAAPETQRLYRADWRAFTSWCASVGAAALPATPDTVAGFLAIAAPALSAGALARRAAAIAERHRALALAIPCSDPAVTGLLRDARRHAERRQPPPPRPAQLARLAVRCPRDLAGLRDRALLLLAGASLGLPGSVPGSAEPPAAERTAAAGTTETVPARGHRPQRRRLDRASLVGLTVEQLGFGPTGVVLTLPAATADAAPRRVLIAGGAGGAGARPGGCPVQALRDWLRASDTRFGPVFRKVDRWGNVEHRALGRDAVRRIIARRTPRRVRRVERMAP